MGTRTKKLPEKEQHIHNWISWADVSSQKCTDCQYLLISKKEDFRRREEWNGCRVRVRETRSYKRFIEQKEAMYKGDFTTVKELALEAREELKNKTDWLPKPNFPDPASWTLYVIYNNTFEEALDIFT